MEKSLDSQLWRACAGGMVQMPKVNSQVFYFPQGHAEHAHASIDFGVCPKVGPFVHCRVVGIQYLADPKTDEVYSRLRLIPVGNREIEFDSDDFEMIGSKGLRDSIKKPASFAKTLTQSDATNGGGFSAPRYCAETIFPRLDYAADPPAQTLIAKDVHGEIWKFRHIYRGTPRRHLLTTGWSTFVNQKKLVAGDSIVFLRTELGELCVGIRRAKRGIKSGNCSTGGSQSCLNAPPGYFISPYGGGGHSLQLKDDEYGFLRSRGINGGSMKANRKVKVESVVEAATLAAKGQPFEVVYYPRACTPEFCVSVSAVKAAMRIQWCPGMKFKMPFETEDSSRISWFMGTLSAVQVADPIRWPNSPWRLLQVTWDEPDLLQNVNRVSPWLVELVSNMPVMNISSSPPSKKLRFPQHPNFPQDGQLPMLSLLGNTLGPRSSLCCLADNTPSGIQGARHAHIGISLSDTHFNNKLHSGLFPPSQQRLDLFPRFFDSITSSNTKSSENVSCLLSVGSSSNHSIEKAKESKRQHLVLFGQPILTEQEIYLSHLNVSSAKTLDRKNSLADHLEKETVHSSGLELKRSLSDTSPSAGFSSLLGFPAGEQNISSGVCHVNMEDEDVRRMLDLSVVQSYQELYLKLAEMFGTNKSIALDHVFYHDATGALKSIGDEPFSSFRNSAKKLTVTVDPGKYNERLKRLRMGFVRPKPTDL